VDTAELPHCLACVHAEFGVTLLREAEGLFEFPGDLHGSESVWFRGRSRNRAAARAGEHTARDGPALANEIAWSR